MSSADGKQAQLTEIDVAAYATGGSGTIGSPYTGWDSAIIWAGNTVYRLRDNKYYSFSTALDLSYTGLQLKGKGILKWTGATGGSTNCIQLKKLGSTNASYAWNVRLEDFTLDTGGAFAGIYFQGDHHNAFRNVAITNSNAAATTHGVLGKFTVLGVIDNLRITQNEAVFGSGGIVNGITLDTDGINGPSTAYTIINPIIEGCSGAAINLVNSNFNTIIGGSPENGVFFNATGNRIGVSVGASSYSNSFVGFDMEDNITDVSLAGRNNTFSGITSQSTTTIASTAIANTFSGGRYNQITIAAGANGTTLQGLTYGMFGGTITDNSGATLYQNVDDNTWPSGEATLLFGGALNSTAPGLYSHGTYITLNSAGANPIYFNYNNSNSSSTVDFYHGNAVFTQTGKLTLAGGLAGTITNDNASAGNAGEITSSLVAVGSPQSLSNGTAANVTSISLTAGDWDVEGNVNFIETTSTVTGRSAGISTTSATLPTDGSEAYNGVQSTVTTETNSITLPRKRISIASTTTVYLVGKATFSAGTCAEFGSITARRVR